MSKTRRLSALVLQHEEPTPGGLVLDWLGEHHALVDVHRIDLEDRTPDPTGYDLVISLGSERASFDDSVPFVQREVELVRRAHAADVPLLGICFGAQLMARALGGRSFRAAGPEIGWFRVQSSARELIDSGPWFQWHFDTFRLPPGAQALAHSAVGPQAYRAGRSLGLQFHPEVTPTIVEGWVRAGGGDLAGAGIDPDQLLRETEQKARQVRWRAMRLFERFLRSVVGLPGGARSETHT